jgi:hypothetical protein
MKTPKIIQVRKGLTIKQKASIKGLIESITGKEYNASH